MNILIPIHEVREQDRPLVGGKAYALSQLQSLGMKIPDALCVSVEAYHRYVTLTGLRERIQLELNRKRFQEMRWEEMWDASLRIRNMFLRTPIPTELSETIGSEVRDFFGDRAVVVRSSAPDEDSSKASFAGLHESYVNIRGSERILMHIRLVWASLWSDAALLYRKELGLLSNKSSMAVLVQEIVVGDRSGVIFGVNPNDTGQAVIEAVYGLNAGLVDGTVEPDRWILDRNTGRRLDHREPERNTRLSPAEEGTRLEALPERLRNRILLGEKDLDNLFRLVRKAESHFKAPQDMEWTFRKGILYVLQSRPITTRGRETAEDNRPWYLSLRRSLDNLKDLRARIENQLIPGMIEDADRMENQDLEALSDMELANEIGRRKSRFEYWLKVYWDDFIPFAHGMRLFGQVYNNTVKPGDPFEFMSLLATKNLKSMERNRLLQEIAEKIRRNPLLKDLSRDGLSFVDPEFDHMLSTFVEELGIPLPPKGSPESDAFNRRTIIPFILEMAEPETMEKEESGDNAEVLTSNFLSCFEGESRESARELLDLGRASYRLRDDDNIYLGRIEKWMKAAVDVGRDRIAKRGQTDGTTPELEHLIAMAENPVKEFHKSATAEYKETNPSIRARQIVGQPAGPGIARGKARVIFRQTDLFAFKKGEILVCDALDPNMTFVVPLSAGIVERRGGMLIHGAIIAREYGIPCVTGVAQATEFIQTGQTITLDGHLGIVIAG